MRTARKQARYRPVLGDLAADPDHLAIFLVEPTGRLADPAMKLLAKPDHTTPFLYSGRWGHYTLQRDGRPCLSTVLSPLLSHLGGGGSGLILLYACALP